MKTVRIAMWSGPRNISTAMMRSWENRDDCMVVDEPLYGPYLYKTKKKHPMYKEVILDQGSDEKTIIKHLTKGKLPADISIYYQKHMSHHILNGLDVSWIKSLKNVFLIRDPRYVLSSYLKKHDSPTPDDLGYPQQLKLFNYLQTECAITPIVLDSKDVLKNPQAMMKLLCDKLQIGFDDKMLSWPKGYRKSDGIWAKHWYNRVVESTEFVKYKSKKLSLNSQEEALANECLPYYIEMSKYKILV
jgi:hypothetical protein